MKQNLTSQNTIQINKWTDYYYILPTSLITNVYISLAVDDLFSNIINNLSKSNILNYNTEIKDFLVLVQFKIKIQGDHFRSISYLQFIKLTINPLDSDQIENKQIINELKEIFIEFWNLRDEDYINLECTEIIFTYKIIPTSGNLENK